MKKRKVEYLSVPPTTRRRRVEGPERLRGSPTDLWSMCPVSGENTPRQPNADPVFTANIAPGVMLISPNGVDDSDNLQAAINSLSRPRIRMAGVDVQTRKDS